MSYQTGGKRPAQSNRTVAPDAADSIKSPVGQGFGTNSPTNRSWLPSGVGGPQSALAKNISETVQDDTLDQVIAGVGKHEDKANFQTRAIDDRQAVPNAHSHYDRNANPTKVPASCGFSSAAPVRKP
jgi:hypothetical protein